MLRVPKGDKSEQDTKSVDVSKSVSDIQHQKNGKNQIKNVADKLEEATPSQQDSGLVDNTSLPTKEITEEINNQAGANDKNDNEEPLDHNKENRKHRPAQENLLTERENSPKAELKTLNNFVWRRRGGAPAAVTESPAAETISQSQSNLFLSTFMGAQRTEAPILSSTSSKMILVTVTESNYARKSNRPAIRIKPSKTEKNSLKISSHRFQPTSKASKTEEQNNNNNIEQNQAIKVAPTNFTSKGNFVERTKLKFLSRTLFKGEAERKSQNLHDVLRPESEAKVEKNEVKETKPPLFAPRPRFGFNFGKRNRNLEKNRNLFSQTEKDQNNDKITPTMLVKDPVISKRPHLNISKFSRKGLKKTFPRVSSQSSADEVQGEILDQTDEATIEGSDSTEPFSTVTTTTQTSTIAEMESTTTAAVTSNQVQTEGKPTGATEPASVNEQTTWQTTLNTNDPHEVTTTTTVTTSTTISSSTTTTTTASTSSPSQKTKKRTRTRGRFRVKPRKSIGVTIPTLTEKNITEDQNKGNTRGRNIRVRPRGRGRTSHKDSQEETTAPEEKKISVRGRIRGRGRALGQKETKENIEEEVRAVPSGSLAGSRRKLVRAPVSREGEQTATATVTAREMTTISNMIDENPITEAKETILTGRSQVKTRGKSQKRKEKHEGSNRSKAVRSRSRSRSRHPNIVDTGDDDTKPSARLIAIQRGRGRGRARGRGRVSPATKKEEEIESVTSSRAPTATTTTTTTTTTQTTLAVTQTTVTTTKEIPTTTEPADTTIEQVIVTMTTPPVESEEEEEEEYLFFPAAREESRENYQQQQLTTPAIESLPEREAGTDLSHHLSSAISLATVTWTQDPYRAEEVSEGSLPTFDIDFSKNSSSL